MNFSPQELIVIGTLAGTLIGSLFTFLIMWISKHYEEHRHFRELMVRTASDQWKHMTTTVSSSPQGGAVQSFDVYLIMMLSLSKLIDRGRHLSQEKVLEILKEGERLSDIVIKHKKSLDSKS